MFTVLITSRNFGAASPEDYEYFLRRGYAIKPNPVKGKLPTEEELCGLIADVDAILVGDDKINRRVLSHANKLKVIAKSGIGVDSIDLAAAKERGIAVANAPGTGADTVADLAMGLMLCVSKKIMQSNRMVMEGKWPLLRGNDIAHKTLGIVGFGAIGRAVAGRAAGFGMRLLAYDPFALPEAAEKLGVQMRDLDDMLPECDYVSLHIPKTPETIDLFDARRLACMKQGAYLINTARGGIVNEDALYAALQSGRLAGAASDVLAKEPPDMRHKLLDCEQFLLTSHIGGSSVESLRVTARVSAENIIAVLEGRACPNIVNT